MGHYYSLMPHVYYVYDYNLYENIVFHSAWMQFYVMTRTYVRQVTQIISNRVCEIWLGIGEGANVIISN